MSTDSFKEVKFNVGQELRAVDLSNAQKFLSARLADQIFDQLMPGLLTGNAEPDHRASQGAAATKWAYALTATGGCPKFVTGAATDKIVTLTAGTVFQKIAATDGDDAQLLTYMLDGTDTFTIADGHATLPRVDLIQMKLEYEDGDLQARVFANEAEYATLDFDPLCANFDTVVRPKAGRGLYGNNISVRTVSGVALGITEVGNLVTLTFLTGVTTVLAMEAYIVANSNLLEIDTAGTAANILVTPGDVVAYTPLAGGLDEILVSQNMNMERHVKATLSQKVGTPAALAVFPDPDAGYVPLAAILVQPAWIAGGVNRLTHYDASALGADGGGLVQTSVADLRMPLNVKRHRVLAKDCIYADGAWKLHKDRTYIQSFPTTDSFGYISVPGLSAESVNDVWSISSSGGKSNSTTDHLWLPVQVEVGQVINNVVVTTFGDGACDVTLKLWVTDAAGVTAEIVGPTVLSNIPAAFTHTAYAATPHTVEIGDYVFFTATPNAATGCYIGGLAVGFTYVASAACADLVVMCPAVSGRLVGLEIQAGNGGVVGVDPTNAEAYVSNWDYTNALNDLVRVGGFTADLIADASSFQRRRGGLDILEDPDETQSPVGKGSATYGLPVWTNGRRSLAQDATELGSPFMTLNANTHLILRITKQSDPSNFNFYEATFFIAEGF